MSEYISLVSYINTQNIYYMFKASPDGTSHLQVPCIKTEEKQAGEDILLFVCFVALRAKSTAMVIAGRSVLLTTLFPGQA